jgi:D-alanine-D-alanine ligase
MRIAITYNADTHLKPHLNPVERLCEDDVAVTARDVLAALEPAHDCELIAVGDCTLSALQAVRESCPDLVVNLCESVRGHARGEAHFAHALDLLGLPSCGCDAVTLALCQDKGIVKRLLRQAGIPSPPGFSLDPTCPQDQVDRELAGLLAHAGRVIVKPAREDGGLGIDCDSVVSDLPAARARVRALWARFAQPALVEAYVTGPEYNLGLYQGPRGLVDLPPGAVVFNPDVDAARHVVGYRHKWDSASQEYNSFDVHVAAALAPAVHAELVSTCARAVATLGGAGYYRFDARQGADGRIHVLDVNPHPDIGPDSGFRRALAAAGIAFTAFLEDLFAARLGRSAAWRSAA